ncbi:MAG: hypothetical protein RMI91_01015 [Gemmatales bacterium]|nr:hypothetical protein [Gemmatales bacterium]MDW7993214.1 hypothetical protein [Gemmatales bacterium]
MVNSLVLCCLSLFYMSYSEMLARRDLALMQGRWEPIFIEGALRREDRGRLYSSHFVIKGEKWILLTLDETGKYVEYPKRLRLRLHPLRQPKAIDLFDPDDPKWIGPGIYDLGQYVLVIKHNPEGPGGRPKDFSPIDNSCILTVLRRLK